MTQRAQPDGSTPSISPWMLLAAAILAQQVASKAVRDGLFLAQLSAADLPRAMLFGAVASAVVVLATSQALASYGPRLTASVLLALNGGLFALEYLLLPAFGAVTAWLLYVHVAALGGTTISAFFSNVSEQFDPHRARLASGRVISGAAIGGMVGGLAVSVLARDFGHPVLLVLLALLNFGCAAALTRGPSQARAPVRNQHAFASLSSSPYLRSIALLVLVTGFSSALLDYNFKNQAAASTGKGPELLQLFAAFHTGTAILTALVQVALAQRALERLGLAGTLAVLPASLLLGGALGPLLPRLWSTLLLRGASSVLEASLFRSAYEPLFTPLSQRARRSVKTLIDVAAGRAGEGLGSIALLALAHFWPFSRAVPVAGIALLGAAIALLLSLRMHSGYVDALAVSLRKGSVRLHQDQVVDSTTRFTLSQTHVELERAQLLAEIAAQRASKPPPQPVVRAVAEDPEQAQLMAAVRDLLSADHLRVTQLLARGPLDLRLVPFAIALLRHPSLVQPVSDALAVIVDHIAGALLDAMHDPQQPAEVRRRVPRILRNANQLRAAEGLLVAMRAPERLMRYRAASALAVLTSRHPELAPSQERVFELVRSEVREIGPEATTIQHMFAILSLVLDRDALELAREALSSGDTRQRGTALEYLHSTLPEPVRSELVAWLDASPRLREDATKL